MLGDLSLPILGRLVSRRIRGYVERFLAVLPRPFRIEVMAVSESICGELCPRDRRAGGRNLGRHRAVAPPVTETKPWRFARPCLRA